MRGHASVTEAVQSLSNVFNGQDLTQAGAGLGGLTSAAVHGMPTGTLVLLNGKRLAPQGLNSMTGPSPSGVDLSLLPLSAVERIEVLRGPAAAIYGSAFGQNAEFAAFYRSLEAYRASFRNRSDVLVLDPSADFFKYFRGGSASAPPARAGR